MLSTIKVIVIGNVNEAGNGRVVALSIEGVTFSKKHSYFVGLIMRRQLATNRGPEQAWFC